MEITDAVRSLDRDLKAVFGHRLRSVVAYGDAGGSDQAPTPTLAVVDGLTADDLRACADRVAAWHGAGLATPLVLGAQEFGRSLDAFPYEFGAILADHLVVSGENRFEGLRVDPAHLRQACEVQARSHLLHLREGYLETRGRSDALAELLSRSARAIRGARQERRPASGWSRPGHERGGDGDRHARSGCQKEASPRS